MAIAIDIRVQATTQSGGFRDGPLQLGRGWSTVNLARPDVAKALQRHAGIHVRIHPQDMEVIHAAGFELQDGRLSPSRSKGKQPTT